MWRLIGSNNERKSNSTLRDCGCLGIFLWLVTVTDTTTGRSYIHYLITLNHEPGKMIKPHALVAWTYEADNTRESGPHVASDR